MFRFKFQALQIPNFPLSLQKISGMRLTKGDKVKFLNESGGGVVSKVVNSNLVHVTIDEGFDIPVLPGELVKVESGSEKGREFFEEHTPVAFLQEEGADEKENFQEEDTEERRSKLTYGKNAVSHGVYLAFVPHDQKFLISGGMSVYMINHTPYDIIYNLIGKGEQAPYTNLDFDTIFAEEKILIDSMSKEEVSRYLEGYVQVIFHAEKMENILLPVHSRYKVQGAKLFKENSFRKSALLNELALVVSVTELNAVEKVDDATAASRLAEKYKTKPVQNKTDAKPKSLIDKHKISPQEAEVDLHISALREDYKDMSNNEILNYQLSYFESTIESAATNMYNKVIYIHGIGNGTLRNMLRKRIKEQYPDFGVRNAPFTRYGNGAIEVLIHND